MRVNSGIVNTPSLEIISLFRKNILYGIWGTWMSGDLLRAVLRRVDRRQKALRAKTRERVSDRSISLKAGLSADYLRSLRRQYDRGTQIGVTTPAIAAIAKALETTTEWLLHGLGPEEPGAPEDNVELRLTWHVVADGDHFLVEEQLGKARRSSGGDRCRLARALAP
jgi:hypothetical protein